ncbi:MAG TPA: hypothetical protein VHS31_00025, partial [Tepidisphaeraceae bacterium]|nr:hypothetical protein [Tepidisphaeraceae bacterium]
MTRSSRQSSRRGSSVRHNKAKFALCSAASLIAAHLYGSNAMATGGTWLNGVGGNYNFTDSTQWFLGNVPGGAAGDLADFAHTDLRSGDTTISLNTAGITLGQINVNDGQVVTQVI